MGDWVVCLFVYFVCFWRLIEGVRFFGIINDCELFCEYWELNEGFLKK